MKNENPHGLGEGIADNGTVPESTRHLSIVNPDELSRLTREANHHHDLASSAARTALLHARECGSRLLRIKESLGHGKFLPWLKDNFHASDRTAQGYMRLAANPQRVADLGSVSIREALKAISDGSRKTAPHAHCPFEISNDQAVMFFHPEGAGYGIISPSRDAGYFHLAYVTGTDGNDDDGRALITGTRRPVQRDYVWASLVIGTNDSTWNSATEVCYFPANHRLSVPHDFNPHVYENHADYIKERWSTGEVEE